MATYMVQAAHTSTAWNKLVRRPENWMEAPKPVIAKRDGEIEAAAARTTVPISPDEGFDAMLLAQGAGYRPPAA